MFGDHQPFPFSQTKFRELGGVFSPDARWIAYQSDDSGSYQVYVQSFPPSGGKWQISSEGGSFPRFRRDGKELFYLAANGKLMAVEVKANTSGLEFSAPKPLFDTHTTDRYAVTADGRRFLMSKPLEESTSAPITVILRARSPVATKCAASRSISPFGVCGRSGLGSRTRRAGPRSGTTRSARSPSSSPGSWHPSPRR